MAERVYKFNRRRPLKWKFQQDGARAHQSKVTLSWLNSKNIELFPHPPYSPDLNPIEMVWAIIKQKLYEKNKRFTDKNELISEIKEIWDAIP